MRASILYLVGLVDYANANTAAIYNVTANTIVQQQPYESSNIASVSSVDIDSQQLDIFIDTQNSHHTQPAVEEAPQVYKQGYQQTIEVSPSTNEFTNNELIIYQQILLDGYTNALPNEDDEVSIKIIEQELTTLYGANSTSKNLITLSFVLSHNTSNNNNGQSTATTYEEYTNKNLNDMTSKLQSANLPVVQVFDIKSNDELDYNLESIIATNSPTVQPTMEPTEQSTEQSTMIPSVSPVTSPPSTDSLSTPFPTVSLSDSLPALNNVMNYVVDSKMVLYSSSQTTDDINNEVVFSDAQKERWEEVTRDYILKSIQSTIDSAEGSNGVGEGAGGLDVSVSLNTYQVLFTPQSEEEEQTSNLRRRLQQQVSNVDTLPLELDFTTNIQLSKQPQKEKVLNGNELVSSAFRSVEDQNEYIALLNDSTSEEEEDTNDIMNNVQSITLEVDNEIVTESSNKEEDDKTVVFEEVEAETQSTTNEEMNERDMLMYIIIIVLGATFLCSITVCCCCGSSKKKSKKKNEEGNKSKSLAESDSMAAAGYDIEQQEDTSSEDGSSTKYDTAGSQSSQSQSENSQAAVYHSISIKAPRGKLGLVLVNNVTNDLAGITRIKDDSILSNQVNVGDLLLSVDEIDCRGMLACDVSELIGSRCENDERVLVLLREA